MLANGLPKPISGSEILYWDNMPSEWRPCTRCIMGDRLMNTEEFRRRVLECVRGLTPMLTQLAEEHGRMPVACGLCACLEESLRLFIERGDCKPEHARRMAARLLSVAEAMPGPSMDLLSGSIQE
jgi:hypothetical protein